MKVVIINKSDATGGAAVVSRRLLEALRGEGVEARMLVCEKLTDSPFIELAAKPCEIKRNFLLERLKIFMATGFRRKNLFKIDTGEFGLPLWKHPAVKEADAVLINWVNQGMLSLKGFKKILDLKKPVVCTMHDMWWMTGICHHAGHCLNYKNNCGMCPLLNEKSKDDLSFKVSKLKSLIFFNKPLMRHAAFVAVSNWLKSKGEASLLLRNQKVEVIPNAFDLEPLQTYKGHTPKLNKNKVRILFGAARLDDPIKGLDTLKEVSRILREEYPELTGKLEIAMFGNIKDPTALEGFQLPLIQLGVLQGEREIRKTYEESDIVVSSSSYETLPGTLVEAQAYGCIPVSFNQGGQSDIIENNVTGFIVEYNENLFERARNLAKGLENAFTIIQDPSKHQTFIERMKENVEKKFSYPRIAQSYLSLIHTLKHAT